MVQSLNGVLPYMGCLLELMDAVRIQLDSSAAGHFKFLSGSLVGYLEPLFLGFDTFRLCHPADWSMVDF